MKSLSELSAIRDRMKDQVSIRREDHAGTRIVVGMATCGIAAGARPVMAKFVEEIGRRKVSDVMITQTGCIGICRYEPVVEVYMPNQEKVTYVKMTPEKAARVVAEHIVNNRVVIEYTIGAAE